jgi:hypothetical protein
MHAGWLIRRVEPLPPVPDRVEPLGGLAPSQPNPAWTEFIESLCPQVREVPAWQRSIDHGGPSIDRVDPGETLDPKGGEADGSIGGSCTAPARCESTVNEAHNKGARAKRSR